MSEPSVAVLVLNYNTFDKTVACVRSLEKLSYKNRKIVIIDNFSSNNEGEELSANLQGHQVLCNSQNLGYAGGNNVGVRWAIHNKYDLMWILNPDTLVEPSTLTEIVNVYKNLKKPGLIGSLIVYDNSDLIYFYKGEINSKGKVRHTHEHRSYHEVSEIREQSVGETDFVNGCSMLFDSRVVKDCGFMPEDFFLYYEDPDWSLKVSQQGFENRVAYRSLVHHMKADNPRISYVAEYYCRRNEFFFRRRNGYPASKVHFTLRLSLRCLKHLLKTLAVVRAKQNMNMLYVLSKVLRAIWQGRMGFEPLKLPYPGCY